MLAVGIPEAFAQSHGAQILAAVAVTVLAAATILLLNSAQMLSLRLPGESDSNELQRNDKILCMKSTSTSWHNRVSSMSLGELRADHSATGSLQSSSL